MKKTLVFLILILTFCGSLFAQNVNNERRIIGTWITQSEDTWVFYANGRLTMYFRGGTIGERRFSVADSKLFVTAEDRSYWIYNISISSDGRTLILDGYGYFPGGYEFRLNFLLTKQ